MRIPIISLSFSQSSLFKIPNSLKRILRLIMETRQSTKPIISSFSTFYIFSEKFNLSLYFVSSRRRVQFEKKQFGREISVQVKNKKYELKLFKKIKI
jgi:hypothetical protein